jgi:hypothetical protein
VSVRVAGERPSAPRAGVAVGRVPAAAFGAALLVLAAGSCGGASKPPGPGVGVPAVPDGTEPIESFEADLIAAGCGWSHRCHGVASVDGCVAGTIGLMSPSIVQDVQAGVVSYDPHLGYRCIQLTLNEPCLGPGDLEACVNAFTGTLAAGADCTMNLECASGSCVHSSCGGDCCPGTCADGTFTRDLPVGAACSSGICAEGEFCAGSCHARVSEGGACGPDAICQAGLDCYGSANPTCVRVGGVGAQCATAFCDMSEAVCDESTLVCAAPPQGGDACASSADCGFVFACLNGACARPGAAGEPCVGPADGTQCQHGFGRWGTVNCVQGACIRVNQYPDALACATPGQQ